ncbi:MAG: histidine kinase [Bacteroidia bacterium]|nr:histidine kinase [Bacteroidia bacterium]
MRPLVCSLLFLALSLNLSHAKKYDLDSLKLVFRTQHDIPEKLKATFRICSYYNRAKTNNDDSLRIYANEGIRLSASVDSLGMQAYFTTYFGATYFYEDTSIYFSKMREAEDLNLRSRSKVRYLKAAMTTYNAAMQYNEYNQNELAIACSKRGISYIDQFNPKDNDLWINNRTRIKDRLYVELIEAYREMSEYEKSIKTLFEQEKFLRENDSYSGLLEVYLQYYDVYADIINQKKMLLSPEELRPYKDLLLENLQKASHLSDSLPSSFGRKGIPSLYFGYYYEEEKDLEMAKRCFEESIEITKVEKRHEIRLMGYLSLAGIYLEENQADVSFQYIQQADSIAQYVKSPVKNLQLYEAFAEYYLAKRQPKKALKYMDMGSEIMLENSSMEVKAEHFELKHKVALANNQPDKALQYYKKQIALKDSLAGQQLAETLEDLRGKYETSQKDVEIAKLNEEKVSQQLVFQRILGFAVLVIMIILFISVAIFQRNRNKILEAKQKSSELKHRLLRSQMNPHFTFNALGAIQNYLLVSDQPNKAAYFLAKFAKLMRQILDQSIAPLISVEEELDTLENYLTIQKLRYDSKFEFQIEVADEICKEKTKIPPVLIQPLLENSIEHGKIHRKDDGIVRVEMEEVEEGFINVKVLDNGIGLSKSKKSEIKREHHSVSTTIIEERINMLRAKYGGNIRYQARELAHGGTETLLVLPKIIQ